MPTTDKCTIHDITFPAESKICFKCLAEAFKKMSVASIAANESIEKLTPPAIWELE